jgi:hypothetical protein
MSFKSELRVNRGHTVTINPGLSPDIRYNYLEQIVKRGNAICKKPYDYGKGHGKISLNYPAYDCSSSISVVIKSGKVKVNGNSTSSTQGFFKFSSKRPVDIKKCGLVIYTYGQGDKGHIFMDVWWDNHRVTFDNCGSRKPDEKYPGHSMWWVGGKNPTRKVYPYSVRYISFR